MGGDTTLQSASWSTKFEMAPQPKRKRTLSLQSQTNSVVNARIVAFFSQSSARGSSGKTTCFLRRNQKEKQTTRERKRERQIEMSYCLLHKQRTKRHKHSRNNGLFRKPDNITLPGDSFSLNFLVVLVFNLFVLNIDGFLREVAQHFPFSPPGCTRKTPQKAHKRPQDKKPFKTSSTPKTTRKPKRLGKGRRMNLQVRRCRSCTK